MHMIIFNGQLLSSTTPCIKHSDRGLTLGHGLFETIFANKSIFPALEYHWHRLETSASLIGVGLPFSKQALETMLASLLRANNLQKKVAAVRLTVTHGESARGILPITSPSPNYVISVYEYSYTPKLDFACFIANTRKNEHTLATQLKSISYLDNILAKKEAFDQGYDEAILLNTAMNVADGSISNIFMVKQQTIYTPRLSDGALPGVIRCILMEELKFEFPIVEHCISMDELLNADEVFLTNALMGVQPVSRINSRHYTRCVVSQMISERFVALKQYYLNNN